MTSYSQFPNAIPVTTFHSTGADWAATYSALGEQGIRYLAINQPLDHKTQSAANRIKKHMINQKNLEKPVICTLGDVHGHLQLALTMAAIWQNYLGFPFEAVLLCGDVGTFTEEKQLDNATRRHAKLNPCELEFLYQWSKKTEPEWIKKIFLPFEAGGIGLKCPIVMVHGNHEGFPHLQKLARDVSRNHIMDARDLPKVDAHGHIGYLPSGCRCRTSSGSIIAGIGGIEHGQRKTKYHPMAYLDNEAILTLADKDPVDILITHQGPEITQGNSGSSSLELLLEREIAPMWFHGHSTQNKEITRCGPRNTTVVVPLGDIAFTSRGLQIGDPGLDGWAWARTGDPVEINRSTPPFWRKFRKRHWQAIPGGQLVCPMLL